jgi:hypothetical protein
MARAAVAANASSPWKKPTKVPSVKTIPSSLKDDWSNGAPGLTVEKSIVIVFAAWAAGATATNSASSVVNTTARHDQGALKVDLVSRTAGTASAIPTPRGQTINFAGRVLSPATCGAQLAVSMALVGVAWLTLVLGLRWQWRTRAVAALPGLATLTGTRRRRTSTVDQSC